MSELAPPTPLESDRLARALHASARPLIVLATQLRRAVLDAPEGMKRALAAAVDRFERELATAGWDDRGVAAASYLLCVWVDEVVADTPWGAGGAGLLERFHGERDRSSRIMLLLSRLAEQPRENRALLELFHTCLSLGLNGPLREAADAAQQLESLRTRVFLTLPQQTATTLSAPGDSVVPAAPPAWRRRLALGGLLLLGLIALGVYTSGHLMLARRVDEVFASMQQLSGSGGAPTATPSTASAVARLAPLLASDPSAGIIVRDEAHRSVLSLGADQLFEPGSTHLASTASPLLAKVGAVLAGQNGKLVVVGHTDGNDTRTARLPSAWHQSYEWAREVTNVLARTVPADRITVEGAADLVQAGDASLPRRRVDIVLYP